MDVKNEILNIINKADNIELFASDEWLYDDSWGIIFRVNGHNAYRTIIYPEAIYFQCLGISGKYSSGEWFDEPADYACVRTQNEYNKTAHCWLDDNDITDDNFENWPKYFTRWIDECEQDNPNYTEYIDE